MEARRNNFLLKLLGLQQDGEHSISRPKQWDQAVPLRVPTRVSEYLIEHASDFVHSEPGRPGRWHFLIGSPGNGKSAAVGDLYRHLTNELNCRPTSPVGGDSDKIEYKVEICRNGEDFARLWLVQDASTVVDPASVESDAASLLAKTLADAQDAGVSLVVCANRGILERVFDRGKGGGRTESRPTWQDQPWYKAVVSPLVQSSRPSGQERRLRLPPTQAGKKAKKKRCYPTVLISSHALDHENLLRGPSSPLEMLIDNAVSPERWADCNSCAVSSLCPFLANARSLHGEWREQLLVVLRRAEVWSGQAIVFREAVSLIGYLLAGCPHDYDTGHQACHPCEWVERHATGGNLVHLASRRLYAALFGSTEPGGLDPDPTVRRNQRVALATGLSDINPTEPGSRLLAAFVNSSGLSTDTGASRLIGRHGAITSLDPARLPRSSSLHECWALPRAHEALAETPGACQLDMALVEAWQNLDSLLEGSTSLSSREAQRVVNRWASGFLLRLGGLASPRFQVWSRSLDEFIRFLSAVENSPDDRDTDELLVEASDRLTRLLNNRKSDESGIRISHCVVASGPAAARLSDADILDETDDPGLALGISFDTASQEADPAASLTGRLWAWLGRINEGLLPTCLPVELVHGLEIARNRAVTAGDYARDPATEFLIEDELGHRWRLYRKRGRVRVETVESDDAV